MRAKGTIKKFDQVKVVLAMKFLSLGCIMLTLTSEILLYMSTPQGEKGTKRETNDEDGEF